MSWAHGGRHLGVGIRVKRRSRVVGIFPNPASAIRLVGAILADMHDEWQSTSRRYLSEDSMTQLDAHDATPATAELNIGEQHQDSTEKPSTPRDALLWMRSPVVVLPSARRCFQVLSAFSGCPAALRSAPLLFSWPPTLNRVSDESLEPYTGAEQGPPLLCTRLMSFPFRWDINLGVAVRSLSRRHLTPSSPGP